MINFKTFYPLPLFRRARSWKIANKQFVWWLCGFAVLLAFLELGQDYISSILNNNSFYLVQSLAYKLFWLLFIPFSMLLVWGWEKAETISSKTRFFTYNILGISLITLVHLFIFSLFLHGISSLVYEEPWQLSYLLTEKLSTRLYIGFSIYIVFTVLYHRVNKQLQEKEQPQPPAKKNYPKTIPVKNGRKTTLIAVEKISWISSDGSYLAIHTSDKKYVIIDSLKNIITRLPDNFKRIHRSTIVNINHIKKLNSRGNGDYDVIMETGQTLRLSRNYTEPLRGLLL